MPYIYEVRSEVWSNNAAVSCLAFNDDMCKLRANDQAMHKKIL